MFELSNEQRSALYAWIIIVGGLILNTLRIVIPAIGNYVTIAVERRRQTLREVQLLTEQMQTLFEQHTRDRTEFREERIRLEAKAEVASKKASDAMSLVETMQEERRIEAIDRQRKEGEYQREISTLNTNMATLQEDLGSANKKIATLETDLASERRLRIEAEEREKAVLSENETLSLEKSALVKRVEELTEKQATMQGQLTELQGAVTRLKANGHAAPADTGPVAVTLTGEMTVTPADDAIAAADAGKEVSE